MAQKKEIISTVNSLIETLKDGEQGFRQSAEAAKDPALKSLFNEFSTERSRFAGELQDQLRQIGESEPEDSSSVAGSIHRAWIGLKAAVSSGDDHAILAECERGEDSAISEYKKAIGIDLSSPLRETVSRQYDKVKLAHDRVRSLRDSSKES